MGPQSNSERGIARHANRTQLQLVHVIAAVSSEASGPTYSVRRTCESLVEFGVDLQLAALDWDVIPVRPANLITFKVGTGPRKLGFSPDMRRWLESQVRNSGVQIVHGHGLWMMPNVYTALVTNRAGAILVTSPRGTLSRWALSRHRFQKALLWHLGHRLPLHRAACIHATSEAEVEDIRRLGFRQPVALIPNGIDVPEAVVSEPKVAPRQLLFLGRIHPIKGIDVLIRAWAAVAARFPEWELVIRGPDENEYLREMVGLAERLHAQRVRFMPPVYGEEKLLALREASLFVLPSHSENFGIAVAEALAAGLPAIVTRGAPWSALDRIGAGWWIENGVDPLVACLDRALSTRPAALAGMGAVGRQWMKREFSWASVGRQLFDTYGWLLGSGSRPSWVDVSA